jgi:hypothetical protein
VTTGRVETMVAQALDDLEAKGVDIPTALRLLATIAWHAGRLDAARSVSRTAVDVADTYSGTVELTA